VICDRFADSTRVYQGAAGGVPEAELDALERLVVGPTAPDLTLILDIEARAGLARATSRREAIEGSEIDPFESRALAFHEKLRTGYLDIARREPGRCAVIEAAADPETIASRIWDLVAARLTPGSA
jgi:dTMP kinase